MIVNLIKSQQMFSLTLPQKTKGQYWITDFDEKSKPRKLISIEASQSRWLLKSNKNAIIFDSTGVERDEIFLTDTSYLNIKIVNSDEKVVLFTESIDPTRQTLTKIYVKEAAVFSIGRNADNNFCYDNSFVTDVHAKLIYDGEEWAITDNSSKNGTYVNGLRIQSYKLKAGDFIYIMGLKIIVGSNFLAVNNPDVKLKIRASSLAVFETQKIEPRDNDINLPDKEYFSRSPRFHREIEHAEIKIDPPPQLQKIDSVPLALMLGPSITMGMTSVSTGLISLTNVLSNGGNMMQALPTLMMSVSMLLGTILWPILTKQYEKKEKIKSEKNRQDKYLHYLNDISDSIKRITKEQSDILHENMTTQEECAERIIRKKSNLWERVLGEKDFLRLRLGVGTLPLDADIKYQEKKFSMEDDTLQNAMLSLAEAPKELPSVPIAISLADRIVCGIYGERKSTDNMLKALILQMISLHSYDELKIILITSDEDVKYWNFVKSIPHFWSNDKKTRFFATSLDDVKELSAYIENTVLTRLNNGNQSYADFSPYYVVVSTNEKLIKKCEAVRQLCKKKKNCGCSILLTCEKQTDLPKETKLVVHADGNQSELFDKDDTTGKQIHFVADKANDLVFDNISLKLSNTELDISDQSFALPSMLSFLEMFNVGKVEHLNALTRWKEHNPTKTLQTPIGVDSSGDLFTLDLHEKFHGPHGLIAGMTGSGKSEFIITYILSLAVNYHPNEVAFILIDYKGGGLAGAFEDAERGIKLPHLAGTITNLDGSAIKRSLVSIQSELRRRQTIFNEARKLSNEGTMDIYKYQQLYRDKVVAEPLPHLFIISDEFAELKSQQPEFMEQLISAARIGRSLGVHLILATQKPSGVVDDQIWSNSKFRICLKVQERTDSQDMIKCPDAAALSQTGRFYLQVGFNELFALGQSAWCGADYVPSDTVEKTVDSSIQIIDNLGHVIMNVKPFEKKAITAPKTKQIVSIIKYLSDLAYEEKVFVRHLWLDPIPEYIYVDELEEKYHRSDKGFVLNPIIGEYDDPFNQRQELLTIPFSTEGNCLIYGSTGNGKTTFLTSLCYSLIKNHNADELNLYILDFGSETLKAFERAPQVGGVVLASEDEKLINLIKMLKKEIDMRREMFSDFGGDYFGYINSSGKTVPNIVVALNNYSGFVEIYEDYQDDLTFLSRDGVKYGVYFAVTAGSSNAVRYKMQQNFKMNLTMQLNDPTDYSIVVGKTDGLIPTKFKGRGLVSIDRVYEFQTAYCNCFSDIGEFLRNFCLALSQNAVSRAKPIPVLPDYVDFDFIRPFISDLSRLPIGISKLNLNISTANILGKVVFPIVSQDLIDTVEFNKVLIKAISESNKVCVIDTERLLPDSYNTISSVEFYENFVQELFADMVNRNNTYKDAKLNPASLSSFEELVYVFIGIKRFINQLSDDCKDKFFTLIEKAEPIYKLHFVISETLDGFNTFSYEPWLKKQISGAEGIWIGYGIADQFFLKVNKVTSNLYDEIGSDYGYFVSRNRPVLLKLLSTNPDKEDV